MALTYSSRNSVQNPDSLTFKDTSFILNLIGSGVLVLDADINLMSWILAENMAELNRTQTPSGWLTKIQTVSSSQVAGNIEAAGAVTNQMKLKGVAETLINGYRLDITRILDATDSIITLNAPPSTNARTDLVFLEAWLMEIKDAASTGTGAEVTGTATENFTITSTVDDTVKIAVNGGVAQEVTLTAGYRTALQVVTDINAVFAGLAADDGSGKIQLTATNRIDIQTVATDAYTILGLTVSITNASATQAENRIGGLLDDGSFCSFGNTDYYGTSARNGGIVFDQIDAAVVVETNRRVQLQYRIRVVDNVDNVTYPEGINDVAQVNAWPTRKRTSGDGISETVLTYAISSTDAGLYIAGTGSENDKSSIGSVDGFCYGVPLALVHRRNTTAYNQITNPNGAGIAIGGTSDRPDGLFNDQIHARDVLDTRRQVSMGSFDHRQLLEESLDLLMKGQLTTNFGLGDGAGNSSIVQSVDSMLYCEQIGGSDFNNINNRVAGNNSSVSNMDPNGQRRAWNDMATTDTHHSKVLQADSSLPANTDYGVIRFVGSSSWAQSDNLRITTEPWASVDASSVLLYDDAGVDVTSEFTIPSDGSTIDFIVSAVSPTFASSAFISVVYDVIYITGGGLFNLPTNMLKVEDGSSVLYFGDSGLASENDYAGLTTASELVRWNENSRYGAFVQSSETAPSNNTVTVTLGSGYVASGIEYVRNTTLSTQVESTVSDWSQSGAVVTINFSSGITSGNSISIGLYVNTPFLRFQEETKAILGVYETKEITIAVDGSGNGTTYLSNGEVGLNTAAMNAGTKNVKDASNNIATATTLVVSSHKILVTGSSAISQNITVTLTLGKTLLNNESLRMWYEYAPYAPAPQADITSSSIKAYTETVTSAGTGGISTRPVTPHLPRSTNFNDYQFAANHILSFTYNSDVYTHMGNGSLEYEITNATFRNKIPALSLGTTAISGARTYTKRMNVNIGLESSESYFIGVNNTFSFANSALLIMAGYLNDKMLIGTNELSASANMDSSADGATGAFYLLGRPLEK